MMNEQEERNPMSYAYVTSRNEKLRTVTMTVNGTSKKFNISGGLSARDNERVRGTHYTINAREVRG